MVNVHKEICKKCEYALLMGDDPLHCFILILGAVTISDAR
jgi:hypothetical protein